MSTQQDDYSKPDQLAQNQYPVVPQPPFGNQPLHHGYPRPPQHPQGQTPMVHSSSQQNMGMSMHPAPGQPYPGHQGPPFCWALISGLFTMTLENVCQKLAHMTLP